jgi:hypothetical protein
MECVYDLFEHFPDGSVIWRGFAKGIPEVRRRLIELVTSTSNKCVAIDLSAQEVVARVNVGETGSTIDSPCSSEFEALRQRVLASTDADERLLLLQRMCALLCELQERLKANYQDLSS